MAYKLITTESELAQLPYQSVVLDHSKEAWQRGAVDLWASVDETRPDADVYEWYLVGSADTRTGPEVLRDFGPLLVIYNPADST